MTNSARKVFVALTALVLVMTSVSAFAQRDDGEKKTKETVAMSQQVYEKLSEMQEMVEAKQYAQADAARRELLYELDLSRQALLKSDPESDITKHVDRSYVNLLRMWADV